MATGVDDGGRTDGSGRDRASGEAAGALEAEFDLSASDAYVLAAAEAVLVRLLGACDDDEVAAWLTQAGATISSLLDAVVKDHGFPLPFALERMAWRVER